MLDLSKGTRLADRYTLERRLARGGEAETWLAQDRLTGAEVALKIVGGEADAADRLKREWQTNIRLMHAHIARVFEFHDDDGAAFYTQQYIDGPDLSALSGKPLDQVLAPIGLIADALRYAHSKGVVHRDIKASNILLDRNGAPYLADFGVSAPVGAQAGGGSAIAQSPQSLAGDAAAPSDDVFALGGLIYELVSGRSPYSSADPLADIQSKTPDALRSADGVPAPAAVQRLVASMLEKDAALRPSAEQVAAGLREAGFAPGTAQIEIASHRPLADEQLKSAEAIRPASRPAVTTDSLEQSAPPSGVSPRTLGIALGALLLLLLGVVFLLPQTVNTDPEDLSVLQPASPDPGGDDRPARDIDGNGEAVLGERREQREFLPESRGIDGEEILFNENAADFSGLDDAEKARYTAEMIVGEMLSNFETLKGRGVQRWAAAEFGQAETSAEAGDQAYLERDYAAAEKHYRDAIATVEPLFDRIEPEFEKALAAARAAFDAGDRNEALRLYELAVAITPNSEEARFGYERTKNLQRVLRLVEQGLDFEEELELDAAETSFVQAVELDPDWAPATEGLARVKSTRLEMEFDQRMSEGFLALEARDYLSARAAFRVAQKLMPGSREPADGLLQVNQGLQLDNISVLEQEALALEESEDWQAAALTYEEILKVDADLAFANEGLDRARRMSKLHTTLDEYAGDPDRLSSPSVMQKATLLVVEITRMPDIGPRLALQRDELSRLLKRAVTPLPVEMVSDGMTSVSVYKVGSLGNFTRRELELRPGNYVAVGVRPGFRDVRLEFRVAPEIDMQPVVVRCEEQI